MNKKTTNKGYWFVKLTSNETMDFNKQCVKIVPRDNLIIFHDNRLEPLAAIPLNTILYMKFVKED